MSTTTNAITTEYAVEYKYKILGFNDDECNCDVCGRQELKGTYAIEDLSTGEIFRAGSVCGAKMAGWTTKQLVAIYKAGEKEKIDNAKKEFRQSAEYIAYDKAIQFLNNEDDEIQRNICKYYRDEIKRKEFENMERSPKSRLEYIEPFRDALEIKRNEIRAKNNLPEKTSLS